MNAIVIHIVVYNEEALLPYTISFYRKRFPDCRIIIHDNGSTDNTIKIAKKNKCKIVKFDTRGKIDDEKLKQLKNNCWKKSKTDWVIVCDCDELIDIDRSRLQHEDKIGTTIILSEAYNMVNMNDNVNIASIKNGYRDTFYDKKIVFNRKKISDMNYDEGAHWCTPSGEVKYSSVKYKLYHYKFISPDYMVKRYAMYKERLSKKNIKNHWGGQYLYSDTRIRYEFDRARNSCEKIIRR